jgi:hypothetical protein
MTTSSIVMDISVGCLAEWLRVVAVWWLCGGCVGWLRVVAVWWLCGGCVVWLCGAWLRGVAACGGCVVAACGGCVVAACGGCVVAACGGCVVAAWCGCVVAWGGCVRWLCGGCVVAVWWLRGVTAWGTPHHAFPLGLGKIDWLDVAIGK